jgi:hypothetical protein
MQLVHRVVVLKRIGRCVLVCSLIRRGHIHAKAQRLRRRVLVVQVGRRQQPKPRVPALLWRLGKAAGPL